MTPGTTCDTLRTVPRRWRRFDNVLMLAMTDGLNRLFSNNIGPLRLARDLGVPPRRVNEIVLGKRSNTPDTALRLARCFGTSERFWLGLQTDFDLEKARLALEARIEREVRPRASAGA